MPNSKKSSKSLLKSHKKTLILLLKILLKTEFKN